MYLIVFFTLLILSFFEVLEIGNTRKVTKLCFLIMSTLLILRYGQGTDYFNYIGVYNFISSETSESIAGIFSRPDFGFNILILISSKLKLDAVGFITLISCITTYFLYLFVKNNKPFSIVSLLVLYSGYFLIYQFSAIRQGLVMSVLLGLLINYLFKRKYNCYFIGVAVCCTIHLSAIILFVVPFILKLKIRKQYVILILSLSTILLILNVDLLILLSKIPFLSRLVYYTIGESTDNNIFAKILRIILVLPVLLVPARIYAQDFVLNATKNIIVLALVVYVCFSTGELIASRLSAYLRLFEIVFIVFIFQNKYLKQAKTYISVFYILIYSVMYFHNIKGFIDQGLYKNVDVLDYPYISIFEDRRKIEIYRQDINYSIINMELK